MKIKLTDVDWTDLGCLIEHIDYFNNRKKFDYYSKEDEKERKRYLLRAKNLIKKGILP